MDLEKADFNLRYVTSEPFEGLIRDKEPPYFELTSKVPEIGSNRISSIRNFAVDVSPFDPEEIEVDPRKNVDMVRCYPLKKKIKIDSILYSFDSGKDTTRLDNERKIYEVATWEMSRRKFQKN